MRDAFTRALSRVAREDPSLVLVTGDLGFGVLFPYMKEFPDRFINAGIAEQSMMSMASGMALEGKTVVVYSIGNFPTLRCLEQIRNDAAYHNANVKIVCVGAGFVYGSLGMSHHATEDMTALRMIPGMRVYAPADSIETEAVVEPFLREKGVAYLRIGRGGEPALHSSPIEGYVTGTALTLKEGKDAYILGCGSILSGAIKASELLKQKGLSIGVASFPTVKPLDESYIDHLVARMPTLFTLEEHTIIGGFGGAVCEYVAGLRENRARVVRFGVNDEFVSLVGKQDYLLASRGLDGEGLAKRIADVMEGKA